MKVPYLPLSIDSFGGPPAKVAPGCPVVLLSHFHTDHMKGLSSSWCAGLIVCSEVTRALVLQRFGSELEDRIVGIPLWRRTILFQSVSVVLGQRLANEAAGAASAVAQQVAITLIPAFHIPGSVMFYMETPFGKLLYTGDFKYEEGTLAPTVLQLFFANHAVDHLYLDDTWLHLGVEVEGAGVPHDTDTNQSRWPGRSGGVAGGNREQSRIKAPMASSSGDADGQDQVDDDDDDDLFRVFNEPLVDLPRAPVSTSVASGAKVLSKLLNRAQTAEAIEAIGRRMDYQRHQFDVWSRGPEAATTPRIFPFKVRVYLHNQFGKEWLIQQLAERLDTRALIDDDRYERLALVAKQLSEVQESADAACPAARVWADRGGEQGQYLLKLERFVSFAQYRELLDRFDAENEGRRLSREDVTRLQLPLIEVVSSRAKIGDAALEAAASASFGAPFYGVVISGWARLQRRRGAPERIWHVPTTLHCAPDETIRFVEALRPLSITPLHYRPSRASIILQRLGPLLRTPYVNHYLQAGGGAFAPASTRWVTPLAPLLDSETDARHDPRLTPSSLLGVSGEDELGNHVRRGFRICAAVEPITMPTAADSTRASSSPLAAPSSFVLPTWKVETLLNALAVGSKRPREENCRVALSLDALADMVDCSETASRQDVSVREESLPANTLIL